MSKYFTVRSSHGELSVDATTGGVDASRSVYEDDELRDITKFDVKEWRKAYPGEKSLAGQNIDILDLGYWFGPKSKYQEPEYDWRESYEGFTGDSNSRQAHATTNRPKNIVRTAHKIASWKNRQAAQFGGLR